MKDKKCQPVDKESSALQRGNGNTGDKNTQSLKSGPTEGLSGNKGMPCGKEGDKIGSE